jgi:methionine synthase I (cobalamin-dependent)
MHVGELAHRAANALRDRARRLELRSILPDLRVVGGCCGTDHEHVTAIAELLTGVRS